MSFWDNVKKFAQPYADDDYDDYDEDEEYLDDYEEPAAPARRAPARRRAPEPAPVEDDLAADDDFGFGLAHASKPAAPAASTGFKGQVVSMATGAVTMTFEAAALKVEPFENKLEVAYKMLETVMEYGMERRLSPRDTMMRRPVENK